MNACDTGTGSGYLRGNELSLGTAERPAAAESSVTPQMMSAIQGKAPEDEPLSEEGAKRVEHLMEQTKAFIRNIDIHNL